uniref:Uncharacterized protein n=1 Tax=Graphocephala atropunctata TaxID=36148 RepID=A0A1B6MLE3_9HEMI
MQILLVVFLTFWHSLCNELDETVITMDADIVNAIIDPEFHSDGSLRKKILRLELALGEITERLKEGDEEGRKAVEGIVKHGGLSLSTMDHINDTFVLEKFDWSKDQYMELMYNIDQICTTWSAMEGGVGVSTTIVYIRGRNRSVGLQYMEKYM